MAGKNGIQRARSKHGGRRGNEQISAAVIQMDWCQESVIIVELLNY